MEWKSHVVIEMAYILQNNNDSIMQDGSSKLSIRHAELQTCHWELWVQISEK